MLHTPQRSEEGETPQRHYQNLPLPDFPFQRTPSKSPYDALIKQKITFSAPAIDTQYSFLPPAKDAAIKPTTPTAIPKWASFEITELSDVFWSGVLTIATPVLGFPNKYPLAWTGTGDEKAHVATVATVAKHVDVNFLFNSTPLTLLVTNYFYFYML
jgi:hypothetical protein